MRERMKPVIWKTAENTQSQQQKGKRIDKVKYD